MYGRKQFSALWAMIIIAGLAFAAGLFVYQLMAGHVVFARNVVLFTLLISAATFMSFHTR